MCDNCSGDGTKATLAQTHPDVRVLENDTNLGFSAANNQMMAVARGQYFLLLNNDCLVEDGSIDALLRYAETHSDVAMIGPQIVLPDGTLQPSFQKPAESPFANYSLSRYSRAKRQELVLSRDTGSRTKADVMRAYIQDHGYDKLKEVDVLIGACVLVRREFVEQCGALDERYFMYREDSDWCLRARKNGWKIVYCPEAKVVHHHIHRTNRSREFDRMLSFAYYDSQLLFCRTHYGTTYTAALAMILAAITFVRMLQNLARSLFLGGGSDSRNHSEWQHQCKLLARIAHRAFGSVEPERVNIQAHSF